MDILARMKLRLINEPGGVPEDAVLLDYIESAKYAYMTRRFPYGDFPKNIEERYKDWVFRAAMELYSKNGAEGEVIHIEDNVHRDYESANISPSLLNEIVPLCGIAR